MHDLTVLLSEVEEFGRAHTFLYKCKATDAAKLLDAEHVGGTAKKLNLEDCLGAGTVLNQPSQPTISAVRLETDARGKSLVIKVVEKRIEHKFAGEEEGANRLTRNWDIIEVRAVNVVRLLSHGLLEVRVASHHSSTKYANDIQRIRRMVEAFIPASLFSEYSLKDAKFELWSNRSAYKEKVRFSSSTLRDSEGATISAAAGQLEGGDLVKHKGAADGLDAFLSNGEAYCESSNLYWLAGKDGALPSKEIHMILPELRNEFAIPANCSKSDYEYVFDQLRVLQK